MEGMFVNSVIYKSYVYNKCSKLCQPTVILNGKRRWSGWHTDLKMADISYLRALVTDIQVTRSSTKYEVNINKIFRFLHKK